MINRLNKILRLSEVKVAVVGGGYWGKNLVRTFSELDVLESVVDSDQVRASMLSAEYNVKSFTFDEVLKNKSINCIVISTPAVLHSRMARDALLANKHVFVEKPLALNINEAEELVDIAAKNNKILMIGHLMQYHPAFIKLCSIISENKLGPVQYIYSNRLNLGKVRKEENILWSFAPHDVSMILSLMGDFPNSISAIGSSYLQESIVDVTTTHLKFSNGRNAHIFVSWLHPFKEQKLIVVCKKGMAVFDDGLPWSEKLIIYNHEIRWEDNEPIPYKSEGISIKLKESEPLKLEAEHFLKCVVEGLTPKTDGR